jgi:glycosyltransferase involved in cell wall biosynthesis
MTPDIAVLIPCYNEQEAIGLVVSAFRAALPDATIFVYDNASTDLTVQRAREAGAVVRTEPLRGKGNVVRRMFADIEADIYVLVDGDNTYDAASAPKLVTQLIEDSVDLVSGVRVDSAVEAYRSGHRFGNWVLTYLVAQLFGKRFTDMLSGYRVMTRRFVKSFPALSTGFEIETELTVHALQMRMPIAEIDTPYGTRPPGSASKLRTISDGVRILRTIVYLVKEERPLAFFGWVSGILLVAACCSASLSFYSSGGPGSCPAYRLQCWRPAW